jgi:hypothetical protein
MRPSCLKVFTKWTSVLGIVGCALVLLLTLPAFAENVPTISAAGLAARISRGDVIIIDVRMAVEWESSTTKIKGAVWEDPRYFAQWAEKYPKEKTIVLYCA